MLRLLLILLWKKKITCNHLLASATRTFFLSQGKIENFLSLGFLVWFGLFLLFFLDTAWANSTPVISTLERFINVFRCDRYTRFYGFKFFLSLTCHLQSLFTNILGGHGQGPGSQQSFSPLSAWQYCQSFPKSPLMPFSLHCTIEDGVGQSHDAFNLTIP